VPSVPCSTIWACQNPFERKRSAPTYIRNRTPTRALDGRIRYEMLYDAKKDLRTGVRSVRRVPSSDRARN